MFIERRKSDGAHALIERRVMHTIDKRALGFFKVSAAQTLALTIISLISLCASSTGGVNAGNLPLIIHFNAPLGLLIRKAGGVRAPAPCFDRPATVASAHHH